MFISKLRHILLSALTVLSLWTVAPTVSAQAKPGQTTGVPATVPAVVLNATADSAQVTMGGRTQVRVELVKNSHSGVFIDGIETTKDQDGQDVFSLGNTEVRQITSDSTDLGNGRIQVNYSFLVQPFDVGTANIGPFKYAYDGDTVYSPLVSIKVLEPDMPQMMRDSLWINPMENVVTIPARWYDVIPDWWYWPLIGILVIAIAVVVFMLYKKNGARLIPHKKKVIPPYPLAVERLKRLKAKRLAESGHVKEYYTELTDILREYLHGRFGIYAREMTSPQIIESCMSKEEIGPFIESLTELLTTADFVKFAKQNPDADENIRSFNAVNNFVEGTKPVETVPDDEKGKTSKNEKRKTQNK